MVEELTVIEYPKIAQLPRVAEFLEQHKWPVYVQEKVDGSNVAIRFVNGELVLQSRTTIIDQEKPQMFAKFVAWAKDHFTDEQRQELEEQDVVLYGEMVGNGKLKYDPATPPFLLFDIRKNDFFGMPMFVPTSYLPSWGRTYNIPVIKTEWSGRFDQLENAESLIRTSEYGTIEAEGIVIKAFDVTCWYTRADGEVIKYTEPILAAKVVREDFKETRAPKRALGEVADPLGAIAEAVVTDARLRKAQQRAEEEGKYDPQRPHTLIPYVARDIHEEEEEYIKSLLFKAYWKGINKCIAQKVIELSSSASN